MLWVCRWQVGAHVTELWLQEHTHAARALAWASAPPLYLLYAGSTPYNYNLYNLMVILTVPMLRSTMKVLISLTISDRLVMKRVKTVCVYETERFEISRIPRKATPGAKTVGIVQLHDNERNPRFPTEIWMFGVFFNCSKNYLVVVSNRNQIKTLLVNVLCMTFSMPMYYGWGPAGSGALAILTERQISVISMVTTDRLPFFWWVLVSQPTDNITCRIIRNMSSGLEITEACKY